MTRLLSLAFTAALLASSAVGCVTSSRTELQLEVFWDNSLGSYTDCTTAAVDAGTEYLLYRPGGTTPVASGRFTPCRDTIFIDREDGGFSLSGSYDIVVTGEASDNAYWYSNCGTVNLLSGLINVVDCYADLQTVIQLEAYWDNDLGGYVDCDTARVDDGTDYYVYPSGGATAFVSGQVFPCANTIIIRDEDDGSAVRSGPVDIELEGYATDGTEWYRDCGTFNLLAGTVNVIECDVPITFP